ncbi:MAG: ABC transporter ATP-binding protein [Methanoregula sp.]|jgi:lipopolysaccharide transport system ATP-binding protein
MSDDIAIRVRGLGKKYTIGGPQERYQTFRDAIVNSMKAPLRRLTQKGADQSTNEFWALKDVSFDVKKGEIIGIIGRNGAGKSTILKILSRITTPTEGEVDIYGRVGSLLEVGTGFHSELTGRENIFLSGSILGMRKREIEQKFDEIVKFSEIEKFIDTPVKRYSSGMYVRLAFAVAAHLETEILLVDEVLAVGDATFQKKCLGKMGDVTKEGRTVLFVSHNMEAIKSLCPRIILLDNGHLIQNDRVSKVIKIYLQMMGLQINELNEFYRVTNANLIWKGIKNRRELEEITPNEDLIFILEFETKNEDFDNLYIDCAIFNEKGENAIHIKSEYVNKCFEIQKNSKFGFKITIRSPKLSPGQYHMTIYMYQKHGSIVFWAENIDLCRIINKSYFGLANYYEGLSSIIIPEYCIEISTSGEWF